VAVATEVVVVRFMQLRGLTGLPIERIEHQFRNEQVQAVLPARVEARAIDALLVATVSALAIVIADTSGSDGRWMTRWAPWDVVRLSDGTDPWTESFEDEYQLFVDVGQVRFESRLGGQAGRKTLRDFVAAVRVGPAHPSARAPG
jgi:hypothetical protein